MSSNQEILPDSLHIVDDQDDGQTEEEQRTLEEESAESTASPLGATNIIRARNNDESEVDSDTNAAAPKSKELNSVVPIEGTILAIEPSSTTATTANSSSASTQVEFTAAAVVFGPVRPDNIALPSPYIEDQVASLRGPDVFAANVKNAFESRKYREETENKTTESEETKKEPDATLETATHDGDETKEATNPTFRDGTEEGAAASPTEPATSVENNAIATQMTMKAPQKENDDDAALLEAKVWHDSIVRRLARLRGLSSWLGERNKRMDGMVEILVRSLENMGVGAVTDHVGNLIPLQNFRLKSAIKLSPTDIGWGTDGNGLMSNDINTPDDHNLPLTTEQMRKYESRLEVLRSENEKLQRALQVAIDNQGALGAQVNQWQACIDSAGQHLCHVTNEVHEAKSRERRLRHLLVEEQRAKNALVQQSMAITNDHAKRTQQNVIDWQQRNNELLNERHVMSTAAIEGVVPGQLMTSSEQMQFVNKVVYSNPGVIPATHIQTPYHPASQRSDVKPWQPRGSFFGSRGARTRGEMNESATYASHFRDYAHHEAHRSRGSSYAMPHGRFVRSPGTTSGRSFQRRSNHRHQHLDRLLDGFFANLNRIENLLTQRGINVPGPKSSSHAMINPTQQQQQAPQPANPQPLPQQFVAPVAQQTTSPVIYYSPPIQPLHSEFIDQPGGASVDSTSQPIAQTVVQPTEFAQAGTQVY
ncbi:uncharacterized protein [Diadema setosum]|uniref:uncharacterized protein isoform X2 n=1 Tax=Diadema setosum TaxID=31175 RepID=UPI003B3B7163